MTFTETNLSALPTQHHLTSLPEFWLFVQNHKKQKYVAFLIYLPIYLMVCRIEVWKVRPLKNGGSIECHIFIRPWDGEDLEW